jgi:hypothetical protein
MANKKKIEVYYAGKSKTLYLMLPNGDSYFVTNGGAVGKTTGLRNTRLSAGGMYENSKLVCELTPKVIRQIRKIVK